MRSIVIAPIVAACWGSEVENIAAATVSLNWCVVADEVVVVVNLVVTGRVENDSDEKII